MFAASNGRRHSTYHIEDFQLVTSLGKGSFGTVNQVVHKQSGNAYAMKVVEKKLLVEKGLQEQFKREVVTQLKVNHMNVVRMLYYFEDKDTISCLLEYADEGQLFAYLKKQAGGLPEPRAATFFVDTTRGIQYLHSLAVIHRDIKPENILLFTDALTCKIADLGWCVELTQDRPERLTFCGTMDYLPPEMLYDEPHDFSLDLWALGVLLFEMLVARPPFVGSSPKFVADQICNGELQIPMGSMSDGPAEIIQGLLVREKARRWSIEKVLSHPWMLAYGGSLDSIAMEVTAPASRPPPAGSRIDNTLMEVTAPPARPPPTESRIDSTLMEVTAPPARPPPAESRIDSALLEVTAPPARPPPAESGIDITLAAADLEITRPAGFAANGQRAILQEQSAVHEASEPPVIGTQNFATVNAELLSRVRNQMDDMNKTFQAKVATHQDRQLDKTIERTKCQSSQLDSSQQNGRSKRATIDESHKSVHVSDSSNDEDTQGNTPPKGGATWPLRRRRHSENSQGSAVSPSARPPLTDTEFLTNVDDCNVEADELERHFINEIETPASLGVVSVAARNRHKAVPITRRKIEDACDSRAENLCERNKRVTMEEGNEQTEDETDWISSSTLVEAGASVWTTLFTGLVAMGAVSAAECKNVVEQQSPVVAETYKSGRRCWAPG